jgi:hypothetical protein
MQETDRARLAIDPTTNLQFQFTVNFSLYIIGYYRSFAPLLFHKVENNVPS